MLQKALKAQILDKSSISFVHTAQPSAKLRSSKLPLIGFALCTLGLVLGILLTVTPLTRLPDGVVHLHSALGTLLVNVGGWLPKNLELLSDPVNALASAAWVEFFLLLGLVTLCYGLAAWLVARQTEARDQHLLRSFIWVGTLLAGGIYVCTPAMLSHDILVYAGYGRVLAIYHANPYFVPSAAFPHDPFTAINFWANTVSIYGPIWIYICGLFSQFVPSTPTSYVLAFRLFALVIHLLNSWLVGRILQQMGRAPRTVTLGMLLYAWNPLMLLESSLGGHNDILMILFVLLGVLLAARTEQRGQVLHIRGYLPPIVALTLAVLVKFTALPILAACLLFLVCKTLRPTDDSARTFQQLRRNWRPALLLLVWSVSAILLLVLALYGPFWFGHTLTDILAGFKHSPSALYNENSFMHSTVVWLHEQPARIFPLTLLTYRPFWDMLTYLGPALCLILGAYKLWLTPTTKNFVLIALIALIPVLLAAPWFFSWYVSWIVSLAVVSLPVRSSRIQTAVLAFTLTFSVSVLLTYLFTNNYQPFHTWAYLVSAITIMPPTCAFFLMLVLWQPAHKYTRGDIKQC
ncbi:MAG: hypothetical protein ABI234_18280 [Ktedonobacteraceae bacterium]